MKDLDTSLGDPGGKFSSTAHNFLQGLREPEGPGYRAALSALCQRYWKPVYMYVRTAGAKSNEDAKDLTQAYFLWLFEGNPLEKYDPSRGTFHGYLKGTLRSFVGHQERALGALNRGGGAHLISLEGAFPSLQEVVPEARSSDPDPALEHVWIVDLVQRSVDRLRERYRASGKAVAAPLISGGPGEQSAQTWR